MNRIIRAFAAFIVSICLILAPAISYAASPAGWFAQNTVMNGAIATITAIKGGGSTAMKAVVQHTPTAAALGKNIVQLGGVVAVAYAVNELVGAGVDWVLDPANNRVKYVSKTADFTLEYARSGTGFEWRTTPEEVCLKDLGSSKGVPFNNGSWYCGHPDGRKIVDIKTREVPAVAEEKYVPYSSVASKITSNAAAGHAPSQDFLKSAAAIDVNSGAIDAQLDAVAEPTTDTSNPPDTPDPNNPAIPFDPSSIIAALQSVMSAITNMSASIKAKMETMLVELGVMQQETNQVINDGMADVVAANQATEAKVGDVVAAIEALEGNTLDGKVINDAVDRVIAEGKTNTSDIVAAIEAIEGNTLDGQVINDAVDRVIANDNANAQSAAEAAQAAEAARTTADEANTAAVTDAIGAQTDAITEADPVTGEMSLKFPKFCSWALPVCTFTDWAMADPQLEEPEDTRPEIQDLTKYDTVDISQKYVTATGQCPPAADLNINFGVVKLSYEPLCIILDKLSGVIVAVAYISVGFMIIRTV